MFDDCDATDARVRERDCGRVFPDDESAGSSVVLAAEVFEALK